MSSHNYKDASHFQNLANVRRLVAKEPTVKFITEEQERELFLCGKPFVVMYQHNDLFSWANSVPSHIQYVIDTQKKYGIKCYPFILMHKAVLTTPVFKDVAKYYVGNTLSGYKELIDILKNVPQAFVATAPEGSNCNFLYDDPLADFEVLGLLKASLETDTNIVMACIKQEKPMSIPVRLPLVKQFKKNAEGIRIPFLRRVKVNSVYEIYRKPITPEQFNALTKEQQKQVVNDVAKDIRKQMIEKYNAIEI
jgi:hypothetical protein